MVSGLTPVVTIVMYWSLINLNKYFYIWLPLTYVCCVLPVIFPVPLCSGINQSQNRCGLAKTLKALQSVGDFAPAHMCLYSAKGTLQLSEH